MANEISRKVAAARGSLDAAINSLSEKKKLLARLEKTSATIDQAQALIQVVAEQTQQNFVYRISDVVSMALDAVFGSDAYEFLIEFQQKRGKTEAEIYFVRDGERIDPLSAAGGGAVDVASFAMRVAIWSLIKNSSGKISDTIVLDEPFRFLSKGLQAKAGEMLSMLSAKLGIQFIMVTHNQDLVESADCVFTVSNVNGESKIMEGKLEQ